MIGRGAVERQENSLPAGTGAIIPGMDSSDARLLQRWLDGDEEAFEELYLRLAPKVLHYLRLLLGPGRRPWAEDVLQEVFLRVHQGAASYDVGRSFSTWLFTIAHHEALRLHRRETLRQVRPLPTGLTVQPEAAPAEERLRELLAPLPETHRSVLLLVHLERLSPGQVSEVLGIPEREVRALAREAIALLRKSGKTSGSPET